MTRTAPTPPGSASATAGWAVGDGSGVRTPRARRSAGRFSNLGWAVLGGAAVFNGISAAGGGIAMLFTDGLGLPRALLAGSPFASFFVPALLLIVVVGGTQLVAAVLLLLRRPSSLFWAALAGFTMVTWILAETAIIRGFGLLQGAYYVTGITELVLVLALLGILPWLPRFDPAAEHRRTSGT